MIIKVQTDKDVDVLPEDIFEVISNESGVITLTRVYRPNQIQQPETLGISVSERIRTKDKMR